MIIDFLNSNNVAHELLWQFDTKKLGIDMQKEKLRFGMVGGGVGAFIGPVHRMAATLDNEAELVCGAFSSDSNKSKESGAAYFLDQSRVYSSYDEMAQKEDSLPIQERIDFVINVTPNVMHVPVVKRFLQAGFHVVCDKPLCTTLKDALEIQKVVEQSGKIFALTHNYTGYPMVKQARYMVQESKHLGKIIKVVVEYPQGWLSGFLTDQSTLSKVWRLDPTKAGSSCCMADIGTHCENLVRYITGLEIDSLCADLSSFIPGNKLDDDGNVLIRYKGGAKGILYASQISTGEENGLKIRIYGDKGGLEWNQENPNYLIFKSPDGYQTIYSKGSPVLSVQAKQAARLPSGHPDGFIEAFANIYKEVFKAIRSNKNNFDMFDFPNINDGVIGMAFIETVLQSSRSNEKWTKFAI